MDKPTPEHIAGLAAAGEPLRPHELAEHLPAVLAAVSSGASVAIADHDGLLAGLVPPVTVGALDALRDISDLHSLARVLGDFPEAFGALQSGLAASIGLVLQGLRRIEYYFRDGRLPLSAHPMSRVELREDGGIASIAFELDMAHWSLSFADARVSGEIVLSDGVSPRVRPILWLFLADGAYLGEIHSVPGSEGGVFRLDGQLPERADIVSTRLVLSMVRV